MRLCTVAKITGLDNREHFAVQELGSKWPIALCGFTSGPNAKKSEQEARILASAPAMLDMLEVLAMEFGNINPEFPLSAGKMAELTALAERAKKLMQDLSVH